MHRQAKLKTKSKTKTKLRLPSVSPVTVLLVRQVLTGVALFTVLGLIVTGLWYGSRIQKLTISDIKVSGGTTVNAESVRQIALTQLAGSYLGLIPKQFAYLYPHDKLVEVVSGVERIKDVEVKRVTAKTLEITYDEYLPDALWCKDKEGGDCFFVDKNGFAFTKAPELNGGSFLRYYSLQDSPAKGKYVAQTTDYLATRDFATKLAESNWFVSLIEIDSARDVFYTLEDGGEIKITLKESVGKTLDYLNTIRQSKEFKHLAPGNFQYLDLRFGTKVFVNEELEINDETEKGSSSASSSIEIVN